MSALFLLLIFIFSKVTSKDLRNYPRTDWTMHLITVCLARSLSPASISAFDISQPKAENRRWSCQAFYQIDCSSPQRSGKASVIQPWNLSTSHWMLSLLLCLFPRTLVFISSACFPQSFWATPYYHVFLQFSHFLIPLLMTACWDPRDSLSSYDGWWFEWYQLQF